MSTPKYAANVIIISEKWTRKGGRYEVKHFNGKDTFEFDDSSERRDQRDNALHLAQELIGGDNLYAVLHEEGREPTPRVERIFINGYLREDWK